MGPVHISLGFYVFEVTKRIAATQKPLGQVRAMILEQLPNERYDQALLAFLKHWRAIWTARTNCTPQYIVPKCRQYQAPVTEDPYTFD
jgi:hypothetical protein